MPWRNVASTAQAGKYKISLKHLLMPNARTSSNNHGDLAKEHRSQLQRAPTSQLRDNFNIKINNDNNI
jgi:hypothetical protein